VTGSGGQGGNEFVVAPLTATLQNPSNISLHTVDLALPVLYNNVQLGHAVINVSSCMLFMSVVLIRSSAI